MPLHMCFESFLLTPLQILQTVPRLFRNYQTAFISVNCFYLIVNTRLTSTRSSSPTRSTTVLFHVALICSTFSTRRPTSTISVHISAIRVVVVIKRNSFCLGDAPSDWWRFCGNDGWDFCSNGW